MGAGRAGLPDAVGPTFFESLAKEEVWLDDEYLELLRNVFNRVAAAGGGG